MNSFVATLCLSRTMHLGCMMGSEDFCRRISLTVGFILNDITYTDNVLHLQGQTSGQGYKKHLDIVHDCQCKAPQAILELSLTKL